ncbi:MAG: hypothetical protein HY371_15330, partial [Devosia nanyangense]|nr:hypothetical protein [Devosia nanyangense]
MKTVIVLSVTALMALTSQSFAGGSHGGSYGGGYVSKPILSPNIAVSVGGIG